MVKDILGREVEIGDTVMFDYRFGNGISRAASVVTRITEKGTIFVACPFTACDSWVYQINKTLSDNCLQSALDCETHLNGK